VRGFFRRTGFPHLGEAPFAPLPATSREPPSPSRVSAASREDGATLRAATDPAVDGGRTIGPLSRCGCRRPHLWRVRTPKLVGVLADLGAEVVKIESQANLDFLRHVTVDGNPNHSWTFNAGVPEPEERLPRSVDAGGRELAMALCAKADIVVGTTAEGVRPRGGSTTNSVARVNADVIYLCSQGSGSAVRSAEAPAFVPELDVRRLNSMWNHASGTVPGGPSSAQPSRYIAA